MIKRDVLEKQSLSEVKMGRGSPICERVRKKIVEYFKNNVPHCQIAKALQISSSTVHNIIKRFRETKAHLKWTVSKWKSVLWSDESKFHILVGNHGRCVLRAKEEGDLPACYHRSAQQPASLMGGGCISAYGMGSLHVLEGTMNAERYIKVLEQHMLPSRRRLFQGRPCVFQQDNAKPHTTAITMAWLRSRRDRVLDWPACSPDLSPFGASLHEKYIKDDHKLFSSWRPISGKNGTKFQFLCLNICYVIYVLL